jgi:hypothetical protein
MPDQATIQAWWAEAHAITALAMDDEAWTDTDVMEFDPYGASPAYSEPPVKSMRVFHDVVPFEKGQKKPAPQGDMDPTRKARLNEAVAFIRDYTGKFGLILDLRADRAWGTKWFKLSDRQVEVVLNCKQRDAEYSAAREQERKKKQTGRDLNALPMGRTYAAVDNDSGAITFLIIDRAADLDRWKQPSRWAGWVFVKQQLGPNEVKLGSQRPGESYSGQWPSLIDKVLADPVAAVVRYGIELGVCGVCGKALTNQESREQGIGPVCRAKLGD